MAFWHQLHSDECFFQLLIPGSALVSLLESESGFETDTQLARGFSLVCRCTGMNFVFQRIKALCKFSNQRLAVTDYIKLAVGLEFRPFVSNWL